MRLPTAQEEKIRIANDLAQKVESVFRIGLEREHFNELVTDLSKADLETEQGKKSVILSFLIKHDGFKKNIFLLLSVMSDRIYNDVGPAFCRFYLLKWELSGKDPKFWSLRPFQNIALPLRIMLFQLALSEKLLSRTDIVEWLSACQSQELESYCKNPGLIDWVIAQLFSEGSESRCLVMAVVECLPPAFLQKITDDWVKKNVVDFVDGDESFHVPLSRLLNLPGVSEEFIAKVNSAYPGILKQKLAQLGLQKFVEIYISNRSNLAVFKELLSFASEQELNVLCQAFPDFMAHQKIFDVVDGIWDGKEEFLDKAYENAAAVFDILKVRLKRALHANDQPVIEQFRRASTDIGEKTPLSYFLHNYSREGTWGRSLQLLSQSTLGIFPAADRCKEIRTILSQASGSVPAAASVESPGQH